MKHKDRDYGMQETVKKVSFKFKEFYFVLLLSIKKQQKIGLNLPVNRFWLEPPRGNWPRVW